MPSSSHFLLRKYQELLRLHGNTPQGVGGSAEGQRQRFDKLLEIGDLSSRSVLDVGCGLGALWPLLRERFPGVAYTGIDIVPESVAEARRTYSDARFERIDLLREPFQESFDYVLMSGVFNYKVPGETSFLEPLVRTAFGRTRLGLGFNFLSTHHNFEEAEMEYHDPQPVLGFCLRELSPRVALHHHYARCDVAVFVYR